jgi:hypothetical protein
VLPDALFLEGAEEALDQAVLLGGVGRDELLAEAVVPAGGPEAAGLEDQPVVGADHWGGPRRAKGPEATNARLLDGSLGFLGPPPQGKLEADDLAVVAVDHGGQVGPAVLAAGDVGDIHGPPFVAPSSL